MSSNLLLIATAILVVIFLLVLLKTGKEIDEEYKEAEQQADAAFKEMKHGVIKHEKDATKDA